ncbi:hypothetical protein HLB44_30940 [Aquincola sp. S2]|uniref:Uncharacterized protein n=1 Tax=Pseudaquabacterium terrae TaxID=2732868 RepID=A0ABX2ESD9_9BURK|nr:hypothetical protein [Aquabacterium terrae]NRF71411.1 hypothetical protein [Aquabacterium terrae]
MSNGSGGSGLPGPEGNPDLEQPPAFKEGIGGGPAMPAGGLSVEQKEGYDEASDGANYLAAGSAAIAVLAGAASSGGGALVFGLISAGSWWLSQQLSDIAEDPPRPHEHLVTFRGRLCRLPATDEPALLASGIVVQRAAFALVTARGLLDSLERLASARLAGDLDWAVTHYGVASQCHQALVVDVATFASALYAAGRAIAGSPYDLPVKAAGGGVRAWIESPGMEARVLKAMHTAGYSHAEFDKVVAWWKTDPRYSGPETTCGRLFMASANALYTSAQRLAL